MLKVLKAIIDFFDNIDLFTLAFWLACINVMIISVISIYHHFNPPDTITRNGYEYELQYYPASSIVEYGCTYVLKETDE